MNDDWRVRIDVEKDGLAHQLTEQLDADELEHDLEHSFHDRVVVSTDGPLVFCYTGSREQAQAAADLVARIAQSHELTVDVQIARWHPVSEEWESADEPEPASP